jgi:hypothetical protein
MNAIHRGQYRANNWRISSATNIGPDQRGPGAKSVWR